MAQHEVIYRQKTQGKGYPKLGSPLDLRPGDYVTFLNRNLAHHTKVVNSVHKSHVMVRQGAGADQTAVLPKCKKVSFKDIVRATRLLTPEDYEAHLYLLANPPPPPPPKVPKVPKGKRALKPVASPPEPVLVVPEKVQAPRAPKPVTPPPVAPPVQPKVGPVKKAPPSEAAVMDIWAFLNDK